jgi:hypothetical protein
MASKRNPALKPERSPLINADWSSVMLSGYHRSSEAEGHPELSAVSTGQDRQRSGNVKMRPMTA